VASLWEQPCLPAGFAGSDKLLHGLMYAILAAATMGGMVVIRRTQIRSYMGVVIGATLYGALLELLQHFCTEYRTGDIVDVYADCLGALAGVLFIALLYYSRQQFKHKK